jgi:ketosteroid isomerase-like protein
MERSAELESWIRDGYAAMQRGEVAEMSATLSRADGTVMIGTDPDEWWWGHETIRAAFAEQVEALGGGFPITAGDLRAYVEGDVGWFTDSPSLELPGGNALATRLSGVVRREDGGWRWVQAHFSFGVPNEEALGGLLP